MLVACQAFGLLQRVEILYHYAQRRLENELHPLSQHSLIRLVLAMDGPCLTMSFICQRRADHMPINCWYECELHAHMQDTIQLSQSPVMRSTLAAAHMHLEAQPRMEACHGYRLQDTVYCRH